MNPQELMDRLEAMNNLRLEIEIIRSKLTWLRSEFKNS